MSSKDKYNFKSSTSEDVIEFLTNRKFKLTEDDKAYIRMRINEATSESWESGTRSNGCDCGQMSCPICCP